MISGSTYECARITASFSRLSWLISSVSGAIARIVSQHLMHEVLEHSRAVRQARGLMHDGRRRRALDAQTGEDAVCGLRGVKRTDLLFDN